MFDCSFSIVAKKSVKVFLDGGVEGRSAWLVEVEVLSAGLLAVALVPKTRLSMEGQHRFGDEPLDLVVAGLPSAIRLFSLYSSRFFSKLGSARYSSKDPARETGAYKRTFSLRLHNKLDKTDMFEIRY